MYGRIEPFPIARIKGLEKVRHLCLVCVYGKEPDQSTNPRGIWHSPNEVEYVQLSLFPSEPIAVAHTRVVTRIITPSLVQVLSNNLEELYRLSPEAFEELVCDRLQAMGLGVSRIGGNIYHKDGGIDIVAWPIEFEFPFLIAVQVKHHQRSDRRTGPAPVRELLGSVYSGPFKMGVLVTNTTFTPDAVWVARNQPTLLHLRDISSIKRWLLDNFLDDYDWQQMPNQIEVCPGVVVNLPGFRGEKRLRW
jgi:hypothetical protein